MQDVPKIVLKRLQETPAAGPHPDADLLTAFAEQSLADSERARVMDHLSRCSDCREVLALALPATELVAAAASAKPARSRWFTWPVLRWGVAVAGMIAVASIGIVQYRQRQKNDTLVSSLATHNEPTAAPQALPQSLPAPQSHESTRQMEREKQAQAENWALSNRADNLGQNMIVRPTNPASPEARALRVAPSGTAAGGRIRSGSAGGAAPKVAPSSPRNTFAVAGSSKNATPEAAAKPAPSPTVGQAVEAPSSSETIEVVESQAAPAAPAAATAKAQPSDRLDEKQKELQSQYDSSTSLSVLVPKDRVAAKAASGARHSSPRWSISADGALQRSFDQGKTWLDVDVNSGLVSSRSKVASNIGNAYEQDSLKKKVGAQPSSSPLFRAVSAQGAEVWAGGSAAMLYHSADYGAHWARVVPFSSGSTLTGDITSIEFSDPQHGRIMTSAGEVWITADDGQTWHRQ
jgi:photosynthesis system II assembly factor YCF48-like protein/putative zinc finger protein